MFLPNPNLFHQQGYYDATFSDCKGEKHRAFHNKLDELPGLVAGRVELLGDLFQLAVSSRAVEDLRDGFHSGHNGILQGLIACDL